MRIRTPRPLLAAALTLLFAVGARAEPMNLSYAWQGSPFEVWANGGARNGAAILILPDHQAQDLPISPISVRAFTSLYGGADRYNDVAYALTFDVSDPNTGQSHALAVTGELDGTVTPDRVNLSNAFTKGSGVQTFDFLGREVTVTFGFKSWTAPAMPWEGNITVSVVGDAPDGRPSTQTVDPASAPEPATLVLAALALPVLGLAGFRSRRRRAPTGAS